MAQDASLTIRLSSKMKTALEQAAARDFRSLSQYVVLVLAEHLGVRDEQPRPRINAGAYKKRRRARRASS